MIGIYRVLHPAATEYTFFSSSHGTFTKFHRIFSQETHLNTLKEIEIIQCLLSEHNGLILKINNRKIDGKS